MRTSLPGGRLLVPSDTGASSDHDKGDNLVTKLEHKNLGIFL